MVFFMQLVQEVPQEECNMVPRKQCRDETAILPSLVNCRFEHILFYLIMGNY